MKIIKTEKYAQIEVSYQTIFDEALQRYEGDQQKVAEVVLDAATGGTWAVWDQFKIDKAIQTVLSKFSNPQVSKVEGVPLQDFDAEKTTEEWDRL